VDDWQMQAELVGLEICISLVLKQGGFEMFWLFHKLARKCLLKKRPGICQIQFYNKKT